MPATHGPPIFSSTPGGARRTMLMCHCIAPHHMSVCIAGHPCMDRSRAATSHSITSHECMYTSTARVVCIPHGQELDRSVRARRPTQAAAKGRARAVQARTVCIHSSHLHTAAEHRHHRAASILCTSMSHVVYTLHRRHQSGLPGLCRLALCA